MSAYLIHNIIVTDNELRGDGKDDPIRRILQFWSVRGDLLAEVDPLTNKSAVAQDAMSVWDITSRREGA